MREIPKAYDPSGVEDKWYSFWEQQNIFHSEPDSTRKPYTIVIPPPNITGMLTLGHVLNNTIQDILIRRKRMQGYNACWVPGTDHASIATESKVVAMLKEQGIDKYEIGREEFLKHCYLWKEKYGGIIIKQLRKLGVSCDWERERFTMDEHYYRKVTESFVTLYRDKKIYKGYRLVNWDPASRSAISDEEVEHREVNGKLWYFKYPVADSNEFVVVATTRPETMLGDTGVAVNPEDERYASLVGKQIALPIVGRNIPLFADSYVDKEFGTGAVKVTPAHDPNDYEMGKRHNLELINIMNPDASLNDSVPEQFRGLDRFVARNLVVETMEKLGLLEKIEDHVNKVGYSQRGGVPIEPYLSEQWFLAMDDLAAPAVKAVVDGDVTFHPNHWIKTYEHWMGNIRDWCISRQLWWGHRIPVWYHNETKEIYCDVTPPSDSENWTQDPDVLDTWASSWLWAHDVFEKEEEQNYYYPTNTLVTGPDIIFFWVARMIMAGLYFKKDVPFRDVYFTSIIRDEKGRKMSKSLGNSPDPLEVISQFGADALRFTIIYLAPLGQDVRFTTAQCELGRNFANKVWNAGRFLLMHTEGLSITSQWTDKHADAADYWILSRLHKTLQQLEDVLGKLEINISSKVVYSFIWNDFCDWYIELIKSKLYSEDTEIKSAALSRALYIFEQLLHMLHPYMPFITEELWHLVQERDKNASISVSPMPQFDSAYINEESERSMEFLQDVITAVRTIRGEMNIAPSKELNLFIKSQPLQESYLEYIKKLTRAVSVVCSPDVVKPEKSASAVVKESEIYIPLEGIIDLDAERLRLQKEIDRLNGQLAGIDKKLSNEGFVAKAHADVIEKERQKQRDMQQNLDKLTAILNALS